MTTVSFFGEHRAALGESPLWDGQRQCLWWVDSLAGNIHAAGADAEQRASMSVNQAIGSIGLTDKGLVGALADGFYDIDVESGAATLIAAMPPDRTLRLNDGKADRAGRFLSGQMQIHGSSDAPSPAALWQLADDSATKLVDGLRLTNAICFAPDGATLYFTDTLEGIIRAHPYDNGTGALGPRRDVVDCAAFGSPPDGATVDADGNLWVALVLGQAVVCISPEGRLLHRIDLPIPYPACPAFGGDGMGTLFVTTIADSGGRLKSDHPDAGRIVAIDGLGLRGLPEGRYRDNHIRE